ncbi:MAG: hypothetical protein IPQ16_13575 [Geobacteraceae bacterium]|nr:hypothetical protein [Geobacteraceae bacterium]
MDHVLDEVLRVVVADGEIGAFLRVLRENIDLQILFCPLIADPSATAAAKPGHMPLE